MCCRVGKSGRHTGNETLIGANVLERINCPRTCGCVRLGTEDLLSQRFFDTCSAGSVCKQMQLKLNTLVVIVVDDGSRGIRPAESLLNSRRR